MMSGFLLHLLRHGAPEMPGLFMGRTDGAPTPEGIAGCIEQVANIPFQAIVSSDLQRAAMTARAIGAVHELAFATDRRWRELDFGAWDGLPPSRIDPDAMGRFWDNPDSFPPPCGERWSSLVGRVSAALDELDRRPTLVVTHGGAIRAALSILLGFEQRQLWAFGLPYGVLLSLRIWPGKPRSAQIIGLWP